MTNRAANVSQDALEQAQEPEFHWPVMLGTAALAIAGIALVLLHERRNRREGARERALAEQLADLLDDTLDDLRDEPDARRAVIAAYARMERALGLHGLPAHEADAPFEYLARVLSDLQVSEPAIRTLTELYAVAKFSDHRIDAEMKEQAIEALESIRDDLRAVGAEQPPSSTASRRNPRSRVEAGVIDAALFAVLGGIAAGAVVAFSPQYTSSRSTRTCSISERSRSGP